MTPFLRPDSVGGRGGGRPSRPEYTAEPLFPLLSGVDVVHKVVHVIRKNPRKGRTLSPDTHLYFMVSENPGILRAYVLYKRPGETRFAEDGLIVTRQSQVGAFVDKNRDWFLTSSVGKNIELFFLLRGGDVKGQVRADVSVTREAANTWRAQVEDLHDFRDQPLFQKFIRVPESSTVTFVPKTKIPKTKEERLEAMRERARRNKDKHMRRKVQTLPVPFHPEVHRPDYRTAPPPVGWKDQTIAPKGIEGIDAIKNLPGTVPLGKKTSSDQ